MTKPRSRSTRLRTGQVRSSPSPKDHPGMPKTVSRVCKLCAAVFDLEYSRGRPRLYCFECEPSGWKVVLPAHRFGRVKLRRVRGKDDLGQI